MDPTTTPDLLTAEQRKQLLVNGAARNDDPERDFVPLVLITVPGTHIRWLIAAIDPEEPDVAWGVGDLGLGAVEVGTVYLTQLFKPPAAHLKVVNTPNFVGQYTTSEYARRGKLMGGLEDVVDTPASLAGTDPWEHNDTPAAD